jgi:deoxyribonuclease-4
MEATGRIDLVHANDSKDPFDSRRDRHQNLGAGEIPKEDLARTIVEAAAPVVVETPGGAQEQGADIEWVRALV